MINPEAPERVLNAPDKIWLIAVDLDDNDTDFKQLAEVSSADEKIYSHNIEYIRSDIAEASARAKVAEVLEKVKNWRNAYDQDDLYYGNELKLMQNFINVLIQEATK